MWLTSVSEGHQHWNVADVPGSYDVITTFDVIHDAVDPAGILRAIRAALRPAGRYVCVDINCLERPTDNTGQIATPLRVQPQLLPDGVPRRGRHWSWNLRPRRARPAREWQPN